MKVSEFNELRAEYNLIRQISQKTLEDCKETGSLKTLLERAYGLGILKEYPFGFIAEIEFREKEIMDRVFSEDIECDEVGQEINLIAPNTPSTGGRTMPVHVTLFEPTSEGNGNNNP